MFPQPHFLHSETQRFWSFFFFSSDVSHRRYKGYAFQALTSSLSIERSLGFPRARSCKHPFPLWLYLITGNSSFQQSWGAINSLTRKWNATSSSWEREKILCFVYILNSLKKKNKENYKQCYLWRFFFFHSWLSDKHSTTSARAVSIHQSCYLLYWVKYFRWWECCVGILRQAWELGRKLFVPPLHQKK